MNLDYHNPVLLQPTIDALNIDPAGVYVDATFGGGGHSKVILERLGEDGRLIAFDQDPDAAANSLDDDRFVLMPTNFRYLKQFLRVEGVRKVDGILADFGVSSHQLDEGPRGFSFRFNADLDMRMNQTQEKTAATILNTYKADELQQILGKYGEVRNAKTVANALVQARETQKFRTIQDLLRAIEPYIRGKRNRYLSQLFQALRIEVNDEIGVIQDFLLQSVEVLKMGGRLVTLTYHSLEDRLMKHFIKKGVFEGEPQKDMYGHFEVPFKEVIKGGQVPSDEEIAINPRARSARLRVAERFDGSSKRNKYGKK